MTQPSPDQRMTPSHTLLFSLQPLALVESSLVFHRLVVISSRLQSSYYSAYNLKTQDNEVGREQLAGFFSLFYASINAGSLLSTFISPILRDTQCFDRDDCFFIAFIVPAVLMGVAIIAFVIGRSKYIETPPAGNIFVEFCSATWKGIKGKFKN